MGTGGVCLETEISPVTYKRSYVDEVCNTADVTKPRSNNTRLFFGNLVAPFPDKDLSDDKHYVPLRDAVRPLGRQEHEKQLYKTDSSWTSHSSGLGAACAARSSKTPKATQRPDLGSKNRCDNRQVYARRTSSLSEGSCRREHHSFGRTIQRERVENRTREGGSQSAEGDYSLATSYSTTGSNGASA